MLVKFFYTGGSALLRKLLKYFYSWHKIKTDLTFYTGRWLYNYLSV